MSQDGTVDVGRATDAEGHKSQERRDLALHDGACHALEGVHPRGFEPLTFGSVDRCSIQLSYGCIVPLQLLTISTASGCGGNGGAALCGLSGLRRDLSCVQWPKLCNFAIQRRLSGRGTAKKQLPESEFIRLFNGNRLTVSNWPSHSTPTDANSTLTDTVGQDGAGGVAATGTDHTTAGMRCGPT